MAWHKIGRTYYSDAERQAQGNEYFHFLMDVCLPGFLTYLGVTALSQFLDHHQFFVAHTTTAKLACIVAGVFMFCIAYSVRRLVIILALLPLVGFIVLGISTDFFHWLFA